jgi:mannose-6-phosphate isomerase
MSLVRRLGCRPVIGYPLLLEPVFDPKIWGGRRLETDLGKALLGSEPIGEALESGDDAGVANGPLAGKTLRDLIACDAGALLGTRGLAASAPFGTFPLLVKFIDAADVLSLQLHPDSEAAAALGKRGKTEAWYIVRSEPDAARITGMSREADADEVRRRIADGTFEELLERRVVRADESLIVPAGTMHAIGAGVLLYEVQENSDITFRLYDWGRVDAQGRPRELHLEDALGSLRHDRHAVVTRPLARDDWREVLAACRYFVLERWRIDGRRPLPATSATSFRLLSCIAGELTITGTEAEALTLPLGRTALLPADLPDVELNGRATVLCSWIGDLVEDVARPLRAAGHSLEAIACLGGQTGDMDAALAALDGE